MSRFRIRRPEPAEAPTLAAFMRTCYLAAYGDVASDVDTAAHLQSAYGDAIIADALTDPSMQFLIVSGLRPDGTDADLGYAWLVDADAPQPLVAAKAAELKRFYLHPDAIGSGAGDTLMMAVLAESRQRLARLVFLSVWKESARAIRFYGRHGFRAASTVRFSIGAQQYDDWLMSHAVS